MGIFLDAASNTALDKKVLKAMKPYLSNKFVGNSRSIHDFGIKASAVIEKERQKLRKIFRLYDDQDIVFTSGATEGNNMVIKGLAYKELLKKPKKIQKRHIICGATDHDSILNPCKQLEKLGFEITYVQPQEDGRIHFKDVEKAVREDTMLVCISAVNNELGVKNEASPIGYMMTFKHIPTLIDATQHVSYGGEDTMALRACFPGATFITFSGHKIYGPEGVGCLVGNVSLLKDCGLIVGGAQEYGLRGGTMNVAGIVGLGTAVELMSKQSYADYYEDLYRYLNFRLYEEFGNECTINVRPDHYNIVSLNFAGVFKLTDSLASDLAMSGIGVSASSACDSDHDETEGAFNPSHVLVALGLGERAIRSTIRVSFCKTTTKRDIEVLIKNLKDLQKVEKYTIAYSEKQENDTND